jgi:hypothetical protein
MAVKKAIVSAALTISRCGLPRLTEEVKLANGRADDGDLG